MQPEIVIILAIWAVLLVCACICITMMIRNEWVYRNRIKLRGTPEYARLPSYDDMVYRWWVWDIKKFIQR